MWRSLVARFVRDEEVVGSNPAIPTMREGLQGLSLGPFAHEQALWDSGGRPRSGVTGPAIPTMREGSQGLSLGPFSHV